MGSKEKINQLKFGAAIAYVNMAAQLMINFLFTPFMLRILGQNEYGLYNLAASLISYLGILNFGFGSAYIKFFSKFKKNNNLEKISKLNGMFLIIFIVLGLIVIIGGIILTYYANFLFGNKISDDQLNTARILMIFMTFNLAFSFPLSIFITFIRANEHFVFQNLMNLLKIIINPLFTLPILLMGYGSIGMILVTTITNLIIDIIQLIYSRKILIFKANFKTFDLIIFKEIGIFSFFIFINLIIDQINWNVDKFLIGRFHGTFFVAVYSVAASINNIYLNLTTAISSVFIPKVNSLIYEIDSNQKLNSLFIEVGRIQFFISALILTGFIFFGKPFIIWWAGETYLDAYYIILLLIIPVTIPAIQNIGIEIQRAKNLHKFRSVSYFIIAIINILISIPLTISYQGIGAAGGTAIALVIGDLLLMNIYYHVKVGINIINFWIEIYKISIILLIPITFGIIYTQITDIYNFLFFLIGISLYIIFYFLTLWYLGFNSFEKNLIREPILKIRNNLKFK